MPLKSSKRVRGLNKKQTLARCSRSVACATLADIYSRDLSLDGPESQILPRQPTGGGVVVVAVVVVVVMMDEEEEEQEKNAQRSNLFCTIYKLQSTQQS